MRKTRMATLTKYEETIRQQAAYWRDKVAQTRHEIECAKADLEAAEHRLLWQDQTRVSLECVLAFIEEQTAKPVRSIAPTRARL